MKMPVLALALAGLLLSALPARAQETAGRVILATGSVVIQRGAQRVPASVGVPLRSGDMLEVGPQSHAQIYLSDESIISLRPETTFRIREYAFDGKNPEAGRSFFDLVKGGMRTVTGLIKNRENYRVSTETVSIGIRGTHYWLVTCKQDCRNADGSIAEDGDYGLVREGTVGIASNGTKSGAVFGTDAIMHVAAEPQVQREFTSDQVFRVARTGELQQLIGPPPFLFVPIGGVGATKPPSQEPAPRQDAAVAVAATGQRGETGGDARITSSITNNTNFTFANIKQQSSTVGPSNDPVLQVGSAVSVSLEAAAAVLPNSPLLQGTGGNVFYRLVGPFNIPTSCSSGVCDAAVDGELTVTVNLALRRATASVHLRFQDGGIINATTPAASGGIPITVGADGRITFSGTFNSADFINNRGAFDCSDCGPVISSSFPNFRTGPGTLDQLRISGTITGNQATVTFGATNFDFITQRTESGQLTATLLQAPPASRSAASIATPRLALTNPNPSSTVGTDTYGAAFFDVQTDSSGRVLQVGPNVGRQSSSVGGATNTIAGTSPASGNLVWGTWTNGTTAATKATITDDNYNTFQPANNSTQVWISGDAAGTLLPTLGTLRFTPVGAVFTSPTQRLNSADLLADFVNRKVSVSLNATNTLGQSDPALQNTFQITGATIFSPTTNRFAQGNANAAGGTLFVTCVGPCQPGSTPGGGYDGFLSGAGGEGAGIAFTAGFGTGVGGITGVVGLQRDGTVQPVTLPTGTVFYRVAGPFSLPTSCSNPPCSPAVAGALTIGVNYALQRATATGHIRLATGEIFNVAVPSASGGLPISVSGDGRVTFGGTFNLTDFPNNRGNFDCSNCGPANSSVPSGTQGRLNQLTVSGIILGGQAVLTLGGTNTNAGGGGNGSVTAALAQTTPSSAAVGAIAAQAFLGGTDTFASAFFDVQVDSAGRLLQVGPSVGRESAIVGGATNNIAGSAPTAGNLVWGTWSNGNTASTKATITDGDYITAPAGNNSVQVWVTGNAANNLPTSLGTLTYTPVGSVFTNNSNQRLNAASLTADFVTRKVNVSINATNTLGQTNPSLQNTFQLTGATTFSPTTSRFGQGSNNVAGSTLSVTCSGPCSPGVVPGGSYQGFIAGQQAEGAGVVFSAGFGSGTGVTGAIGFKR